MARVCISLHAKYRSRRGEQNEIVIKNMKNENLNDKSNKEALKTTIAALLRGLYNLSQIENNWRRFRGRSKYEKINC